MCTCSSIHRTCTCTHASTRSKHVHTHTLTHSFAVVLWELITGERPYRGLNLYVVAFGVGSGSINLPIPDGCPEPLDTLMNGTHNIMCGTCLFIVSCETMNDRVMHVIHFKCTCVCVCVGGLIRFIWIFMKVHHTLTCVLSIEMVYTFT